MQLERFSISSSLPKKYFTICMRLLIIELAGNCLQINCIYSNLLLVNIEDFIRKVEGEDEHESIFVPKSFDEFINSTIYK